ncbi:hypothetical protein E4U11_000336 [Claviceps purpurea]|nr:hypothetical protein E4U11_000336 [Claviceps purpurea]
MVRQFKAAFRVRRKAIADWLGWLVKNNPLYAHVVVSDDRLSQLPEDGDVSDQLATVETNAVQAEKDLRDATVTENDNTNTNSKELWEGVAVQRRIARQKDFEAFKEQILEGANVPGTQ